MQELKDRIRSLEMEVIAIRARQNTLQAMMERALERLGLTEDDIAALRSTPEEFELLAEEHEKLRHSLAGTASRQPGGVGS